MSHLALRVARSITGQRGVALLACGSDGIDGTSSAAGAAVDGGTWTREPDAASYLARYDSASLFSRLGSAIVTGPTGTNFTDLMILARD